jgi:G3E family GTPase
LETKLDLDELDETTGLIDHVAAGQAPGPVPVMVLTGFLGAGKTTLLNRILTGSHGLRVAVLVNDFGDLNIDADLVTGVGAGVMNLANGCVCCTIRDDLIESVLAAIGLPERPEYIVLEASGVAEPSGIATTFALPDLRSRIRLDSVTCVLDAEQVFKIPELMELKIWQAACADLLILNKVDLADRAQIDRVRAWLDGRMHRYRLIEASRCDVPLDLLMSAGHFGAGPAVAGGERGSQAGRGRQAGLSAIQALDTWSFETDRPFRLDALRAAAGQLPAGVYRAKGIVQVVEVPDRPVIMHVVGRRVDLSAETAWPADVLRSKVVAIGARGAMRDGLGAFLECSLAAPSEAGARVGSS